MINTFEEARSFIEKYYPNSSERNKMTKIGLLAKFGDDLLEKQAKVNKSAIGGVSGSVYFDNNKLKNIAKNAEDIYKSKTIRDVKFNKIWLETIQKLCEQAKTDR